MWNGTTTGVGSCTDIVCFGSLNGAPIDTNIQVDFPVEKGATGILITLTWPDATNDLDIQLMAPDFKQDQTPNTANGGVSFQEGHAWSNSAGTPGAGDSPAKLTLTDAKALAMSGKWGVYVGTKLATQESFKLTASVAYGGAALK
jgi:hypothetical protein